MVKVPDCDSEKMGLLFTVTAFESERLGSLHLRLGSHSPVQALLGHEIFFAFVGRGQKHVNIT